MTLEQLELNKELVLFMGRCATWPPSMRVWDVTGFCANQVFVSITGVSRERLFAARLAIAARIDNHRRPDVSTKLKLKFYLAQATISEEQPS